jgi:anaerobic ribonucleoside-triphosphate reductase
MLNCHDCKKELQGDDEYMTYMNVDFIKCRKCHEKDPILRNFQETEVYSRVVGYIRPVKQWNKGKKAEFSDRVEFKNGCCGNDYY